MLGEAAGENLTHEERNTFVEDLTHFLLPILPKKQNLNTLKITKNKYLYRRYLTRRKEHLQIYDRINIENIH